MKNVASTISTLFIAAVLCFLIALILIPVLDGVTECEVESYSFHATITDKAIVDEYRKPREYLLFFVDGEEAGAVDVMTHEYARYAIGDTILVNATVVESIFGEGVIYDLGD